MSVPTDDMEALFNNLSHELQARAKRLEELQNTLVTFQEKPELFDERDINITRQVLAARNEEFCNLNKDFHAAQELYRATVMELEAKIREKEDILRQVDKTYGSISTEDDLRVHFAQKQAQLLQGVQKAKSQLCAAIYDKLKLKRSLTQ